MTHDTRTADTPAAAALTELLEREHAMLLNGDIHGLTEIVAEKQDLLAALVAAAPDTEPAELEGLRTRMAHNQALMNGALEGMRTVAARMSAMRKIRRSLDTYDQSGRRTTIQTLAHSVERQA